MNELQKIEKIHNLAMDLLEQALIAKAHGNIKEAQEFFLKAFESEKKAANLIACLDLEPSRSILQRSAATLAMDCGKYQEAEHFLTIGLSGNPSNEILGEFKDLSRKILARKPKKLLGWLLSYREAGGGCNKYWYAGKSISGKLTWVYIGKDLTIAEEKIKKYCFVKGIEI